MLKETTNNDKNNTKVILNLHQGHFKVKIAQKSEYMYLYILYLYMYLFRHHSITRGGGGEGSIGQII